LALIVASYVPGALTAALKYPLLSVVTGLAVPICTVTPAAGAASMALRAYPGSNLSGAVSEGPDGESAQAAVKAAARQTTDVEIRFMPRHRCNCCAGHVGAEACRIGVTEASEASDLQP
jgi:hypothetical protein